MAEVTKNADAVAELECDRFGFRTFVTPDGWQVFFRVLVHLAIPSASATKLGFARQESEPDSFTQGACAYERFRNNLEDLAADFCVEYANKLYKRGFRLCYQERRRQVLKDGTTVGPGVAVYQVYPSDDKGREIEKLDVNNVEAIAFGNAMNYSRDGVRVTVKSLEFGIISGGPIYEAVVEDPEGKRQRVFIERLGLVSQSVERDAMLEELVKFDKDLTKIQEGFRQQFAEREWNSVGQIFKVKVTSDGRGKLVLNWKFNGKAPGILTILRNEERVFSQYTYDDNKRIIGFTGSPLIESTEDNSVTQALSPGGRCSFSFILWNWRSVRLWEPGVGEYRGVIDRLDFDQAMLPLDEDQWWEGALDDVIQRLKRKSKMAPMRDDAEVWQAMREELGMACPAFDRMSDAETREIFHRVKVRLGLAEDE